MVFLIKKKRINKESIALVENGTTQSNSEVFSDTWNTFFSDVVKNSGILQYENPTIDSSDISVLLLKVIAKYENHPSVRLIKNKKN